MHGHRRTLARQTVFDSAESVISHLFFSIPAVKGVEFGAGFEAARMRGSKHNDPIISPDGTTATNNAGGAGGITNGNPVVARVVVKPTSSISSPQITLNTETGKPEEELKIKGRHDACIALRAPVVVEAAMAIALCDLTLIAKVATLIARTIGGNGIPAFRPALRTIRKVRFPLARILGYSIIHGRFGNYV